MIEFLEKRGELVIAIVAIIAIITLVCVFISQKKREKFSTKMLTLGAIAISLSMVLNLITLYTMPNGGSVTLGRLVPLLIFSYIFGIPAGFIIGSICGLLDFLTKPYFVHIVQFLLDYPLAFSCCGFAALFRKNIKLKSFSIICGTMVTGIARFLFSTISGVLYWGLTFVPSMVYNSVLLVDSLVSLIIIFFLTRSKSFMTEIEKLKG